MLVHLKPDISAWFRFVKAFSADRIEKAPELCELIKEFDAPRFVARYSLRTPAGVKQAKAAILKGLQNQLDGNGFSFIELLTNCPTTWHTDPLGSLEFMEKYTEKYFECKVFADREGRFWE